MAGTRITQPNPTTLASRRYGSFAGKALPPAGDIITVGEWTPSVAFAAGDEWYVTIEGPAIDAPRVRLVIEYDC